MPSYGSESDSDDPSKLPKEFREMIERSQRRLVEAKSGHQTLQQEQPLSNALPQSFRDKIDESQRKLITQTYEEPSRQRKAQPPLVAQTCQKSSNRKRKAQLPLVESPATPESKIISDTAAAESTIF
jgi:hypothetical protein